MDVGGPHAREEQQDLVGEEVHGIEQQGHGVGHGLQHAVQGVESKTGEGRQCVLLVILVVLVVQVPAAKPSVRGRLGCAK